MEREAKKLEGYFLGFPIKVFLRRMARLA